MLEVYTEIKLKSISIAISLIILIAVSFGIGYIISKNRNKKIIQKTETIKLKGLPSPQKTITPPVMDHISGN